MGNGVCRHGESEVGGMFDQCRTCELMALSNYMVLGGCRVYLEGGEQRGAALIEIGMLAMTVLLACGRQLLLVAL